MGSGAVVGVRYFELVTFNGTGWNFGKFVTHEKPLRGGFLPVFWDVPRADTHAVEDIGAVVEWLTERCSYHADAKSSLAVLHNRNDMTTLFRASNWVSESKDPLSPEEVVLAQTRVGFLTGGRKKSFLDLPQDEQTVQLGEAYARATVAITRARSLCLIMGPLDKKGLLGAATVMGTLMYGAGHVWAGRANFYLHGEVTDQLWFIEDCENTRRVSPFRPDGPEPPLRCRRFAYGYALDGSEFPCRKEMSGRMSSWI